jgi:hypothetical protein
MYVGTQLEPRDDTDFQVWAQLGATHVCVDPPGGPHHWSLDALCRHKDHVESFGLSLDIGAAADFFGPDRGPGQTTHPVGQGSRASCAVG